MTHTHKLIDGVRVDLTEEEISELNLRDQKYLDGAFDRSIQNLRQKRNNLLQETDFYALSDVTMSEAMEDYRQQLRDITNGLKTTEDVKAVEFPTKPN